MAAPKRCGAACRIPYFSRREIFLTPSRQDGIPVLEECRRRKEACLYLMRLAEQVRLPLVVAATATTYFHCFYMRNSFAHPELDSFEVAAAALFLAGKTEDTPQKLAQVLQAFQETRPKVDVGMPPPELKALQHSFLRTERRVLEAIEFTFSLPSSLRFLALVGSRLFQHVWSDAVPQVLHNAFTLVQDSLVTPLACHFRPQSVAVCCLFMALLHQTGPKTLHLDLPEDWFTHLCPNLVDPARMRDICCVILHSGVSAVARELVQSSTTWNNLTPWFGGYSTEPEHAFPNLPNSVQQSRTRQRPHWIEALQPAPKRQRTTSSHPLAPPFPLMARHPARTPVPARSAVPVRRGGVGPPLRMPVPFAYPPPHPYLPPGPLLHRPPPPLHRMAPPWVRGGRFTSVPPPPSRLVLRPP